MTKPLHKTKTMKTILAAFAAALLLTSCGSGSKPDDQAFLNTLDSAELTGPVIDGAVLGSILDQIPSPLETSVLLKQSGKKYNQKILNEPDNVSKYNTNFKKALNLGVYGTDLGYTNIYEQKIAGIKYLSSIKTLAQDLGIGQYFDVETIGKLATNSRNLDSLLLITTQNFNLINQHLQRENKSDLSVLLLIGGWMEAMEITCQVAASDKASAQLKETIGAQKIILEQLVLLLSFYEQDQQMAALRSDFNELQALFETIKITYTYKESTMEIVGGVAMIKDNSTTTIDITDEDVTNIQAKMTEIRNRATE
jgi:hypothetical protein